MDVNCGSFLNEWDESGLLAFLVLNLALLPLTLLNTAYRQSQSIASLHTSNDIMSELGLAGLAFFTKTRDAKQLSLADLYSTFQDHPLAFGYFPATTLFPPPVISLYEHINGLSKDDSLSKMQLHRGKGQTQEALLHLYLKGDLYV